MLACDIVPKINKHLPLFAAKIVIFELVAWHVVSSTSENKLELKLSSLNCAFSVMAWIIV